MDKCLDSPEAEPKPRIQMRCIYQGNSPQEKSGGEWGRHTVRNLRKTQR